MTAIDNIKKHFKTLFHISDNIIIVENCDLIKIPPIKKGILIIYAAWSEKAIRNFIETINTLETNNYNGDILIVDNDIMMPEFQIQTFGQVCHGWGEIFIINDGQIVQQFFGRDSFQNFKEYFDKYLKG